MKRLLLYCSASDKIDQIYNDAARATVRAAAAKGYMLVSGGTVKGTMGVICEEAHKCRIPCKGVLPLFMAPLAHPFLTETIWTGTMSERKEAMREGADLVVALPGGIGTMDELFETMVLAKLGRTSCKLAALNINGFYDPLDALLRHMVDTDMLEESDRRLLFLPRSVEELTALM